MLFLYLFLGGGWMNEIKNIKHKKERGITNEEWFEKAKEQVERCEQACLVTVNSDGSIENNWTGGQSTLMIGALEWAKYDILTVTDYEE